MSHLSNNCVMFHDHNQQNSSSHGINNNCINWKYPNIKDWINSGKVVRQFGNNIFNKTLVVFILLLLEAIFYFVYQALFAGSAITNPVHVGCGFHCKNHNIDDSEESKILWGCKADFIGLDHNADIIQERYDLDKNGYLIENVQTEIFQIKVSDE